MYVCVCKAVSDKDIHAAVEKGARSMRELRREFDVCGGCGKCGLATRDCLNKAMMDEQTCSPCAQPMGRLRSALYSASSAATTVSNTISTSSLPTVNA